MSIIDALGGSIWAIRPEALQAILAIAQRQDPAPWALHLTEGRRLDGAQTASVVDGVAIVPLVGPVFPRANLMTEMSGATSLQLFARDLRAALADPQVRQVLLQIDSPGGLVNGIDEAARFIAADRAKPVTAFVEGVGASAAYWLAAAADELVVAESALVGSIGVVVAMPVQVEPDQRGEMEFEIVSANAPAKRPDPRVPEGRAVIQARLDDIEALFIESVARGRGVSAEAVKAGFGRGDMVIGRDAVARGMADRTGSFETVLAELAARDASPITPAAPAARHTASEETDMDFETLTIEALTEARPDLVEAISDKACAEIVKRHDAALDEEHANGVAEERARILGIEERAGLPGHEDLVATLKADGKTTPEQAAAMVVAAEREKGGKLLAARRAAEDAVAGVDPAPSSAPDDTGPAQDPHVLAAEARQIVDAAAAEGRFVSVAQAMRQITGRAA